MSGTHKERSRLGGGCGGGGCIGGGGGGGDDDEEGGGGSRQPDCSDDKTEQKCFRKVKRVSIFRFRKVRYRRRQKGNFVNSQCWGGGGGVGGCFLCMKRSMTVGSSGESPTSDPNSAEFSYDMLRGLIEKNDFLGKDCNTHLMDVDLDVDKLSPISHRK